MPEAFCRRVDASMQRERENRGAGTARARISHVKVVP